jgi:hypothetical protein
MKIFPLLIIGALFLPLTACKQIKQSEAPQHFEYLVSSETELVSGLNQPHDQSTNNNNSPRVIRTLAFQPSQVTMALNMKAKEGWRLIHIDRRITRTAGSINWGSSESTKGIELNSGTEAHFFFERAK